MPALDPNFVDHTVGSTLGAAGINPNPIDPQAPPEMPWWAHTAESMPGLPTLMGATAWRGSNTAIGGGWADRGGRRAGQPVGVSSRYGGFAESTRSSIRNNNPVRPSTWMRYGSHDIFLGGETNRYTPYHAATRFTNWSASKMGAANPVLDYGVLGRMTAASRVGSMNNARFAAASGNLRRHLMTINRDFTQGAADDVLRQGPKFTQKTMLMNMQGTFSGKLGGFMASTINTSASPMSASPAARTGAATAQRWAGELGLRSFSGASSRQILTAGTTAMRGQGLKVGAKLGAKAAAAIGVNAVPIAGQVASALLFASMAYDITKLAVTATGHGMKGAVRFAGEGYKSFLGGLRVGGFQQDFRDNETTMTSRQRGVMAIQNSRLNARSVLGSEASQMAAHFG